MYYISVNKIFVINTIFFYGIPKHSDYFFFLLTNIFNCLFIPFLSSNHHSYSLLVIHFFNKIFLSNGSCFPEFMLNCLIDQSICHKLQIDIHICKDDSVTPNITYPPPNTLQMILVDMDFLFKFWLDFSCCFSSEYEYTFISNLDIVIVLEIVCFRLEEENGSWCFWCMCVCVFVHSTFHPLATFIAGSLIDFHFIHPFIHSFASIFVVHFTIHVPISDIREFWLPVTVNLKLICNGNYLSYNLIMAHRRTTFAEEKNFLIGQQT